MTGPDDELQHRLRASLDDAADGAPHVDLARSALTRARGLRRRRRVTAVAVSAVAVAAVIPIGLRLGSDPPDDPHLATAPTTTPTTVLPTTRPSATSGRSSSTPVDVEIDGLPLGAAPRVPYVDGSTFHGGSGSVALAPTADPVKDVVELDDGIGVWTQNNSSGNKHLSTNGSSTVLPTDTTVSNPAVDARSGAAVWAIHGEDASGAPTAGDTLVATRALTNVDGSVTTAPLTVGHVMGATDGTVIFNAIDGQRAVVGRADIAAATYDTPWPSLSLVTAVSPDLTRFAATVRGQSGTCTSVLSYPDGDVDWRSCEWRPMEFSSDGARVLAYAPSDGLGPRDLAVLDASNGDVLGSFTTKGTFGRATFEDADTMVAVVLVGPQSVIVRCTVDGSCELATTPAQVTPDDPDSLIAPYQITAN